MNINEHTGKEMRTGHATKAYVDGWEVIFGKVNRTLNGELDEKNSSDTGHTSEAGSTDGTSDVVGEVHMRPTP